jgi:hypothetical protein
MTSLLAWPPDATPTNPVTRCSGGDGARSPPSVIYRTDAKHAAVEAQLAPARLLEKTPPRDGAMGAMQFALQSRQAMVVARSLA